MIFIEWDSQTKNSRWRKTLNRVALKRKLSTELSSAVLHPSTPWMEDPRRRQLCRYHSTEGRRLASERSQGSFATGVSETSPQEGLQEKTHQALRLGVLQESKSPGSRQHHRPDTEQAFAEGSATILHPHGVRIPSCDASAQGTSRPHNTSTRAGLGPPAVPAKRPSAVPG